MYLYTERDMDVCERSDHDRYGLALCAERIEYDHDEYGAIVPIVTGRAFRSFIGAWASNDRNGTFNPEGIEEGDGMLSYTDTEGDKWTWTVVGVTDSGEDRSPEYRRQPMYRLTGFGAWYS